MTVMMEERGEEITESSSVRIRPHLSQSLHIQSPLADVHSQTPEGKRSARGHGVPSRGKALLNPSIYTHTYTHTIPILIPHALLTSLLKHRSKSPDWSQQLRNKWCQIPDFCMAFSAGWHERPAAAGFGIPQKGDLFGFYVEFTGYFSTTATRITCVSLEWMDLWTLMMCS